MSTQDTSSANKSNFDTILVLDFGSQYTQLIARRVREMNVYSEIFPWDISSDRIQALNPKGIILSGGPQSVTNNNTSSCTRNYFWTWNSYFRNMLWNADISRAVWWSGRHRQNLRVWPFSKLPLKIDLFFLKA